MRRLALVSIALLWCTAASSGSGASSGRHAASWWGRLNVEEQQAYLDGISDCLQYDVHRDYPNLPNGPDRGLIGEFYEAHPAQRHLTVLQVLPKVPPQVRRQTPSGGEVWPERHAYFDGLYWKGSERGKLPFIQGYLDCRAESDAGFAIQYPGPPERYVSLIDKWYERHPNREDEKIALVLARFRHPYKR